MALSDDARRIEILSLTYELTHTPRDTLTHSRTWDTARDTMFVRRRRTFNLGEVAGDLRSKTQL